MSIKNLADQRLLVVAPHPDDEVLGCGGLISKIKYAGGKVYVLIVTLGDKKQYGSVSDTDVRLTETKNVMKVLNVDDYEIALIGDEYHLKLDRYPQKDLIELIEKKSKVSIEKVKPTIIALPYGNSYFQDHREVFKAGFAAVRPRPSKTKHTPEIVLVYEQPDVYWTTKSFNPNFFVDITGHLSKKLEALSFYPSQSHSDPHPCSSNNVKNIALVRAKQICVEAAEAYMCYRFCI